jgi:pimeloyl-ACP methyl ester carboxylesterase
LASFFKEDIMQQHIEIERNGLMLRGMLHTPENIKGKIPMVILFHGFMNNKCEHYFSFVEVSRKLEELGVASIRCDFIGSGESDGAFEKMSVETEIGDGISILRYARNLDYVDCERIALVGMSFGGLVASIIAGRLPEEVKALCLWAPAAIAARDAKEGRAGDTDLTAALTTGIADIRGHRIGRRFVEDSRALDVWTEIKPYKNSVLLIWGETDFIVPPEIVREYENAYGDKLEKRMIKGVGHMFETLEAREEKLEATLSYVKKELLP